jgi:Fe-S cluster assembly iron-binding protein IscA
MFEITRTAREKIKESLKGRKDNAPIRITASRGGCCGSFFSISFDESRIGDEVFEYDSYTYVIDKALIEHEGPISIDYIKSAKRDGFRITVQNESYQHNLISLLET